MQNYQREIALKAAIVLKRLLKGGESSSQFPWYIIAEIEQQFLIFFILILGLQLQRYSTNTKTIFPEN